MSGSTGSGDRQRAVLGFVAGHSVVLADQVARLLGVEASEASELLADLVGAGVVFRSRAESEPRDCFVITPAGLDAIGNPGAPRRFEPAYRHAVGVAWLWLSEGGGSFGRVDRVLSGLEMRAEDEDAGAGSPFFVEPHEFGGRFELHYPDVMLIRGSERMAVELLLVVPSLRQLEAVLSAYAADVRIAEVMFVVVDPRIGRVVQAVAGSLELLPMSRVQIVTFRR